MRRWLGKQVLIILYVATIAQAVLAIVSLTVYHYRFM